MWSLAVEEQFYLLWPLIVLGVLWLARRRLSVTGAIVAVGVVAAIGAVASAIWMAVLYVPGGDPSRVYYGTDTRAQAMLVGAALSVVVLLHGPVTSRRGSARAVGRRRSWGSASSLLPGSPGTRARSTTSSTGGSGCSCTRSRPVSSCGG